MGWRISCGDPCNNATTGSFFTAPADGTLTFTFEGYSADDTDQMVFAFNGDALFTNNIAAVGDVIQQIVVAGQIYQLGLRNNSAGDTWSSDPASNWDGQLHLASTSTFSDFRLGAAVPTPVSTGCALVGGCYFGWEDLPGPGADDDFNDLVFALQFTPTSLRSADLRGDPVPEPGTLTLLCAGLLGLGFITRLRA
jgi:hypothetical protein